ncbi:SGNH/GDSL hydrolase family protein [Nocardioides sp.]|uniref:SGNH/GDSL hydrolase family protein n=1 Tax=Nocardioides sp. TaxID=35761 RepID=UPI00321BB5C2
MSDFFSFRNSGLMVLAVIVAGICWVALQTPSPPLSGGTAFDPAPDPFGDPNPTATDPAEPTDPTEASDESTVVVLGDSFTASRDGVGETWPSLVGDKRGLAVEVNAPAGAGYVAPGSGEPVKKRVPRLLERFTEVDLWVLAAGYDDIAANTPRAQIAGGAEKALTTLAAGTDAPIVMVSPFAPGAPSQTAITVGGVLQEVCEASTQCQYVDATAWLDKSGAVDGAGLPTDKGQKILRKRFLKALPQV